MKAKIVKVSPSLILQSLGFNKDFEMADARLVLDATCEVVELLVRHSDFNDVPNGDPYPTADVRVHSAPTLEIDGVRYKAAKRIANV